MKLLDIMEVDAEKLKAAMKKNKDYVKQQEKWREKFYKKGRTEHPGLIPKSEMNKKD